MQQEIEPFYLFLFQKHIVDNIFGQSQIPRAIRILDRDILSFDIFDYGSDMLDAVVATSLDITFAALFTTFD